MRKAEINSIQITRELSGLDEPFLILTIQLLSITRRPKKFVAMPFGSTVSRSYGVTLFGRH